MKHKRTITMTAIVLALLLGLVTQVMAAGSIPLLRLPEHSVIAHHYTGTQGTYFDVLLSGVGVGYDVQDGQLYPGHCIDRNSSGGTYDGAKLFSSYDPNMPPDVKPLPWDKINYLINHKLGTAQEIQYAIEVLIYGNSIWFPWTQTAQDMIDAANANGSGFVPAPGQVMAVIVWKNGLGPAPFPGDLAQDSIIEVPVPELGALGDYVWEDLDEDGIQDENEPGINGVTVRLYDCAGNRVAITTTADDASGNAGYYLFDNLDAGCYYVQFVPPGGYVFSPQDQGADDAVDSDPKSNTGWAGPIDLEAGERDLTWDAGLYRPVEPAALGDYVWEDLDGDGIQDANEPGLNGVTVVLYDCAGNPVASTTTADDGSGNAGYYLFGDLTPGCYEVEFVRPEGYVFSPQDQGTDDGADSDANPTSGRTGPIDLAAGETDRTWDAGLYEPATLGDYVWQDLDADGIQDANEPGINGVTVVLYDCAEPANLLASTTTADDASGNAGYYLFDDLAPGCYVIEFVRPDGYAFSPQDQGTDDGADSDANPTTGRTAKINLGYAETDLTWDAGLHVLECGLVLEKLCTVPVAPTPFVCSDAKPIDELTMVWNGTQTVRVVAWYGNVGSSVVGTAENVAPGDVVTISGFAGSPNDVYWEIFAGSVKIGESTFHLSCSDDNMNGPEDCGLPEGDGKDKVGYLNDWLLEGMAGANGLALVCTPTPPTPSDTCEVVAQPAPSCQTLGKPTSLTFRYTGGGCAASDNTQDPSKAVCTGGIDPSLPVVVTTSNSGYSIVPGTVEPGQEFTVSASSFNSDSYLTLSNAGGTEENKIHTSCSQPLEVGDVFGSLTLVAFNGQRAASQVTYIYNVTNNGSPLTGVTVTDDALGQVAGPFDLASGESRTFEAVAEVSETTTSQATAAGMLANGSICEASDTTTVVVTEPCAVCMGGTTELTFRYLGTQAANVVVYDDPDAKADKILFQGLLQPGDEFTLTPRPGQDKLNNDISIWVNGVFHRKVHTSCSQPIGPGMVAGDFEIVSGRSKDNGLMCPLTACAPQPAAAIAFQDREVKWDITNTGDLGLEIKSITVSWPAANGALDEIKRDADVIHKGDFAPPSAVIDSGWESDVNKRTIKPGETDTLRLKFINNADTQGEYHIVVEFAAGCSIEIEYVPGQQSLPLVCTSRIQAMSLSYTGPELLGPTTVEVDPDKGVTVVYTLASLSNGQVLSMASHNGWTVDATVSGESELGARTAIRINGVEEVIHTSCSTPFVAGAPAPLDDPKGAPSPNWFVEAFRQQ